MGKKALLLAVVVVVVCLCSSARALDPLGPPTAQLNQGQIRLGFEYFYETSEIQIDVDGENAAIKVKEHMVTANIGYGISDSWEVFARLGAEVAGEATIHPFGPGYEFEGDESFVYGGGTRATFYEQGKVKLGALFQMNWGDSDGDVKYEGSTDSAKIDTVEWGVAVGPSYQLNETVSLYGGPFLYFLDGDVEVDDDDVGDLEESSSAGGYFGVQVDLSEDTSFNVEWLHTHDSDALAMMYAWEF